MPDETPMHQGYESARAYLLTLFRIQNIAEDGSLDDLLTSDPANESFASILGKIDACRDLLTIIEKIQTPGFFVSRN